MKTLIGTCAAALVATTLTSWYHTRNVPAELEPQVLCDDSWQPAQEQILHTVSFTDATLALHSALALPDTGADFTLVARCLLEKLEAHSAAHRTPLYGTIGGVFGTRAQVPVWEVTLVLYPYSVKTRVFEHANNAAPVILGRDVLGSIGASIQVKHDTMHIHLPP